MSAHATVTRSTDAWSIAREDTRSRDACGLRADSTQPATIADTHAEGGLAHSCAGHGIRYKAQAETRRAAHRAQQAFRWCAWARGAAGNNSATHLPDKQERFRWVLLYSPQQQVLVSPRRLAASQEK